LTTSVGVEDPLVVADRDAVRGGGRRVLVVDDDPLLSRAIVRILVADDYVVDVAHALRPALERLDENAYAAVVTDFDLGPGATDGGDTILRASQVRQPDALRVLMTGRSMEEVSAGTRELAHEFLAKPFSVRVLSGMLCAAPPTQ
jgi:DNA-binding response OmpR family regulator